MTFANPAPRILGTVFIAAGALHFIRPKMYEAIIPDHLPAPAELVFASGVAEIAGGVAVHFERTRRAGGWFLIATMLGVFPANVGMAFDADRYAQIPEWALWARLPLQALIIAAIHRTAVRDAKSTAH